MPLINSKSDWLFKKSSFHFPLFFFLSACALLGLGLVNLYSATQSFESAIGDAYFSAQVLWCFIGLIILISLLFLPMGFYKRLSYPVYILSLILLSLVLILGQKISGHQSWLALGPIHIQPSEIAKIALVMILAKYLSSAKRVKKASFKDLLSSFMIFILPMGLVLLQGDLGSSLFFVLIYASLILVNGVKTHVIIFSSSLMVLVICLSYLFLLSPYQKNRIHSFMNPEEDRRGTGYHLIQSRIAVGSGGLTGKGYQKGETHKLKFLPERHTDFIYSVFAEEWGFLGSLLFFFFVGAFLISGLDMIYHAIDRYSFFLGLGLLLLFFWHFCVNLWGVLGLMPLTGVPLPFMSYGGSALVTHFISVALLLKVGLRR